MPKIEIIIEDPPVGDKVKVTSNLSFTTLMTARSKGKASPAMEYAAEAIIAIHRMHKKMEEKKSPIIKPGGGGWN